MSVSEICLIVISDTRRDDPAGKPRKIREFDILGEKDRELVVCLSKVDMHKIASATTFGQEYT